MANIKGITIEINGDTSKFQKEMQGLKKEFSGISKELSSVNNALKFNPGNSDLLAQKMKLLKDEISNTTTQLDKLKDAQKQMKDAGLDSVDNEQWRKLQTDIITTESKLKLYNKQLKEAKTEHSKFDRAVRATGEALEKAGGAMKNVGKKLTTSIAGASAAAIGLVETTEETRSAFSKLETNAEQAGLSFESVKDAYTELGAVTDDTGERTEALSNLMKTGFDESQMTQAVEALSGAVIQFPDTLKIEGLADGLQETMATGKAIGPFAEMLERLGFNLEDFDAGLAEAKASGDEMNYVMGVLAETGMTDVYNKFKDTNAEQIEYQQSQDEMKAKMAELAEVVLPVVNEGLGMLSGLLERVVGWVQQGKEWFNGLSTEQQELAKTIAIVIAALGPFLVVLGTIFSTVGKVMGAFKGVGAVLGLLSGPVGIAIAVIGGLIAVGVLLYKNWDTIKEYATKIWTSIKDFFSVVMEAIKNVITTVWDGIKAYFTTLFNIYKTIFTTAFETIKSVVTTVFEAIKSVVTTIWDGVKKYFTALFNAYKTLFTSAFNAIKTVVTTVFNTIKNTTSTVWNGIKTTVSNIVNGVKTTISRVFNSIKTTVSNIWNGIKNAITSPIEAARRTISNIIDRIKGLFNFKFTWPKIPLPHFSMTGSLNPLSENFPPRISLDWYAQGGIFNSPSIIGVGEAGSEAVMPTHKLDGFLEAGVERVANKLGRGRLATDGPTINVNFNGMVIREEADIRKIRTEIERISKRELRGGGF